MPIERLGVASPTAFSGLFTELGLATKPTVASVIVVNRGTVAMTTTIFVEPVGFPGSIGDRAYIIDNLFVEPGQTFETFRFALEVGDKIFVGASTSNGAFVATGLYEQAGRTNVLYQEIQPGSPQVGDIWINSQTDNVSVFNGSHFSTLASIALVGPSGFAETVGPVGPMGPPGIDGPPGVAGPQGQPGAQGLAGSVGVAGGVGPQGDIGPAGPPGNVGATGDVGAAGPIGPEGPQGPGSQVTVSATAPETSLNGDLWFDSTDGQTYIRYVDTDSSQWVAVAGASATSSFQLGAITPWAADVIPSWALELTGQAVSRTAYSGLFALLGTSYGAGDGTATFNIPDYRGRTLVGQDASQPEFDVLGETGGAKTHTLTTAEMPSHSHPTNSAVRAYVTREYTGTPPYADFSGTGRFFGNQTEVAPQGGGQAHNNLQPYTVVKWIICAASSSGNFDTEVQTALVNAQATLSSKSANTPLSKNYIINGGMDIWQRGNSIQCTSTLFYSADRWEAHRSGFATGMVVSRSNTATLPGFFTVARVGRSAGSSTTARLNFSTSLETEESTTLQGKQVTLSFYSRALANYSSASSILTAEIVSGTGQNQNFRGGFTGAVVQGTVLATLTSAWQRYTVTGTVPVGATQVGVRLFYDPVGTAGAADEFDIVGVQLEEGTTATPFRRNAPSLQAELAACQRYYYRISGGTTDGGILQGSWYVPTAFWSTIAHPVPMRVGPAPSISGVFSLYAQGENKGHTGFAPYGNSPTQVSSMTVMFTGTASTTPGVGGWAAVGNGNTGTFIQFDAEL